ncbi:MAG: S41 family peptidase [Chitinophagaceae bacterium]
MRYFVLASLLLSASFSRAQNCDCDAQFAYVTSYFEQNNPAFQKIKTDPAAYKAYHTGLQQLHKQAKAEKDNDRCVVYMDRYIALLKDHHSDIGFNFKRIDLGTPELINAFKASANYLQFKKTTIDTARLMPLLRAKKYSDPEGLYTDGGSLVFGIVREENRPDHYAGIVVKGNKLMDIGHVLLELERKPDNSYDAVYHIGLLGFNVTRIFKNLAIENGQIANFGFYKINTAASNELEYEFRVLDDSTGYLRLTSFDWALTGELDSLYEAIDNDIRQRPYLVVDLRNNGGGSERSYQNLVRYAYTKPLKIDPAFVWVSPENIKRYEEKSSPQNKELIERMKKAAPFTFIPQSETGGDTWTQDSILVFPRKIALLYNRGTASAAEGMIYYYRQSDKVITIGERSGGYIGYGNVMTAPTPCGKFTIRSTTTRYSGKSAYEFTGIPPMYTPPSGQDWLSYAETLLKTSR